MSKTEIEETKQCLLFMCNMTLKTIIMLTVFGYGLIYAVINIRSADAAELKTETIVTSPNVYLSDIFYDIPDRKNVILGMAPQAGQTIILNAKTLKRIANMYDVDWMSKSAADQVILKRESQTIGVNEMIAALTNNFREKGVGGDFGVSINNVAPSIVIPADVPATIEIAQMSYVPGRDVFTATLAVPSIANPIKTISLSGMIEKMRDVPVLKSSLKNGDIIGSSDIEWLNVAERKISNDTVLDADILIGKTPVRNVDANIPVRARDILSPQLVARGDEILIQFINGGMSLSAKGKAMQNGAEGDMIRVTNLSSNQSFQAEITGNRMVRVQ